MPQNVVQTSKKGKVIEYKCSKCGATLRNIVASDDDRETIYKIVESYAKGI